MNSPAYPGLLYHKSNIYPVFLNYALIPPFFGAELSPTGREFASVNGPGLVPGMYQKRGFLW
jgi:hypothetical protein